MKKFTRILSLLMTLVLVLSVSVMADGTQPAKYEATGNYEDVVEGTDNPDAKPLGTWKAGSNKVYSLVDLIPAEKKATTVGFSSGDYEYYKDSITNNSYGAAINGPYKFSGQGYNVGKNIQFTKGFGTHPKANQTQTYINFDISAYTDASGSYQCDTFYACVGLTNTASPGIYFQVFADYGDGQYKHIANSSVITGAKLGEFNVDVTGVKVLRLVVITATMANSSSACAWMDPSLFKADKSASEPSDTTNPGTGNTTDGIKKYDPTDNFEELHWSDDNRFTRPYGTWGAGSNEVYSIMDIIPKEKIVRTSGYGGGDYEYYTDSTTSNQYGASINGPYTKSHKTFNLGAIFTFDKGFGTHPKPAQEPVYIDIDISAYTDPAGKYQCDTFYSCVGLTNAASPGIYFQVFADYGDGQYKLIGNSTVIVMQNIGEFNVDVTGVKMLRLVVITSSVVNSSSSCTWGNPCLYKKDAAAVKPSHKEYNPADDYANEPIIADEIPTVRTSGGIVWIVVGVVLVAVIGAVAAVLIVKRKKKNGSV